MACARECGFDQMRLECVGVISLFTFCCYYLLYAECMGKVPLWKLKVDTLYMHGASYPGLPMFFNVCVQR